MYRGLTDAEGARQFCLRHAPRTAQCFDVRTESREVDLGFHLDGGSHGAPRAASLSRPVRVSRTSVSATRTASPRSIGSSANSDATTTHVRMVLAFCSRRSSAF